MAKLPHYGSLWMEYYDYIYYPDSAEVKKEIGGAVDAGWITNTCAIRVSGASNVAVEFELIQHQDGKLRNAPERRVVRQKRIAAGDECGCHGSCPTWDCAKNYNRSDFSTR